MGLLKKVGSAIGKAAKSVGKVAASTGRVVGNFASSPIRAGIDVVNGPNKGAPTLFKPHNQFEEKALKASNTVGKVALIAAPAAVGLVKAAPILASAGKGSVSNVISKPVGGLAKVATQANAIIKKVTPAPVKVAGVPVKKPLIAIPNVVKAPVSAKMEAAKVAADKIAAPVVQKILEPKKKVASKVPEKAINSKPKSKVAESVNSFLGIGKEKDELKKENASLKESVWYKITTWVKENPLLAGLASLPVVGAIGWGLYKLFTGKKRKW